MMKAMHIFVVLLAACVLVAQAQLDPFCIPLTKASTNIGYGDIAARFRFGLNDSTDGTPAYSVALKANWVPDITPQANFYLDIGSEMSAVFANWGALYINEVLVQGGRNYSTLDSSLYTPTAGLICSNNNRTVTWGPSYPNYTSLDKSMRGHYRNLEVHTQWSAPVETSFIRILNFIKNTGSTTQPVRVWNPTKTNTYLYDRSAPVLNDGHYYVGYPWKEDDPGQDPAFKASYNKVLTSWHAAGWKGRDPAYVYMDHEVNDASYYYDGEVKAGQEIIVMNILAFSRNLTQLIETGQYINFEPMELFHDLTADQLSEIVNWNACDSGLRNAIDIDVKGPEVCSPGPTTDFNVTVTKNRNDFTTDFMYRIVHYSYNYEVVPLQASNILQIPNGYGEDSLTIQVWYRDCMVNSIGYTPCTVPPASPVSPVSQPSPQQQQQPQGKVSEGHTLTSLSLSTCLVALLAQWCAMNRRQVMAVLVFSVFVSQALGQKSECNPFSPDTVDPATPATIRFGMNFSPDGQTAPFTLSIAASGWYDGLYISPNLVLSFPHNIDTGSMSPMTINGAYVMGGKGYKTYNQSEYERTAYFDCSADNSTATWGPAYPDYLSTDEYRRFNGTDLEVTMEYYAPRNSSFVRIMTTINNQGFNEQPIHVNVRAMANTYLTHVGPSVKGRYLAGYPWRDDDPGANYNFRQTYNRPPYSSHARGPKARDTKFFVHSRPIPTYQDFGFRWPGSIQGNQKIKIMHVINFAPNKTKMLEMAQWIDSEPAEIFAGIKLVDAPYVVNWGACPAILGPKVNVSIQVQGTSSNSTTIQVFASPIQAEEGALIVFYHRISYADGDYEIIPQQSPVMIDIPTSACSQKLKHQLWYGDCIIKETLFNC